jgi:hypothetical protein
VAPHSQNTGNPLPKQQAAMSLLTFSRVGLLLGILTVLSSIGIVYYAYEKSVETIFQTVYQENLNTAKTLREYVELRRQSLPESEVIKEVKHLWQNIEKPYPNSYLCIIQHEGKLAVHTSKPQIACGYP